MNEQQAAQLVAIGRFAHFALGVLNARLLTLLALAAATALFAWTLYQPDVLRLATSCAFALLVFWPVQRLEHQRILSAQRPAPAPAPAVDTGSE